VLPDRFFSDRTASQILGELMDIRGDCQSWLAAGEAHYSNPRIICEFLTPSPNSRGGLGWGKKFTTHLGLLYHDRKGKAEAINKAPQWLMPARIY